MEAHQSPTQQSFFDSCRHSSLKRKQEPSPSQADQQAAKRMRRIDPDRPRLSIERESYLEPDIIFNEDHPIYELRPTPIFIDKGVLVGFWYADPSGNGRRPVYCLVEDLEFAYQEGDSFISTRYNDFDPLDDFGDWLGDDTEDVSPYDYRLLSYLLGLLRQPIRKESKPSCSNLL